MSLWPASDEITLTHAGASVRLRPSLRAASILAQEPGFEALFRGIEEFHVGTVTDVIRMTATDWQDVTTFLDSLVGKPLINFVTTAKSPLMDLARAFIPAADSTAKGKAGGTPMTWPEVYREFYNKATGWLGWTPRQAWEATPNEINSAYRAHVSMLKATGVLMADKVEQQSDAVYSPERLKQIDELGYDPAFDPAALRALKAKVARGAA
jgi:hypothetical protein